MIRLALFLLVKGGREQLLRLAVLACGVGLGVSLLLLAAATFPAIQAHEARSAWTNTSAHNIKPDHDQAHRGPLLWRTRVDAFAGKEIVRIDVAALGPHAPLPPGLAALPGPGQLAASPAMRALLRSVPADQLADRYPGVIVATVGKPALVSPRSLVVVVGYSPDELRGRAGVLTVHSIETQATSVSLTRMGRVMLGVGSAALLVPILVLISTATRLSAARREQRLASMRLVGATPGQVRAIAAAEALLGALAGLALGFLAFLAARPLAARLNIDGSTFFVSDLRLSAWAGLLIGVGVPALAAGAALISLRRLELSPLGVARQAPRGKPTWRRLVPLTAALLTFAVLIPGVAGYGGSWAPWAIAAAMTALVVGIVIAGPWFTLGVGRALAATAPGPATLLAGRRLIDNATAGFRSISGLVLSVFLVTLISEASASAGTPVADPGQVLIPATGVGVLLIGDGATPVPADQANSLTARIQATPGVTGLLDLRWAGGPGAPSLSSAVPVLTRCADLRASGLGACPDPASTVGLDARLLGNGFLQGLSQPTTDTVPERLPLLGILALTDGQQSTMERVRTLIETSTDATTLPWTGKETKAESNRTANLVVRFSDAALLLTLLIAGVSLAVSIAGGLLERRRPYAILRLSGMRATELRRVLAAETIGPLLTITLASVGLGFAVAADVVWISHSPWRMPEASYWWTLSTGLTLAIGVTATVTLPILNRTTTPETARFE